MASYQYVYVMKNLSKSYPGGKEVLKGIYLSFYPGAKIGVLGPNGAGKSTLLRIMAGQDKDFFGTAKLSPGFDCIYVPQEPVLDPEHTVMDELNEAVKHKRGLLTRYDEINAKFGE